ncbi:MAG: acyltransferase [Candidatus Microbacterium colombiense]|nr:MAG: acyltransferase [Microbacterium sp.]
MDLSRVHWIDVAKALAVILVVVYHVRASMGYVFAAPSATSSAFWAEFNETALPVRMPLFFLAAGFLAHTAIARPWRVVVKPRIVALLWPYVLWSLAFAAVAGFAYRPEKPFGYTLTRLVSLPFANSAYWFLLMLPLFFILAKLLQRWAAAALAVALVLAVAAPWLEAHVFNQMHWALVYGTTRIARYSFWYLLGCYGFRLLSRTSRVNPLLLLGGGGAAFAGLTLVAESLDLGAPLSFVLSVAGVTALIGLSIWAARFDAIRRASRYLSARTLPIYLIHPMLIVILVLVVQRLGPPPSPADPFAPLVVPLISAACIAVSVIVYDRIRNTRAAWLFAPPSPTALRRRESPGEQTPSATAG